MPSRKGTQPAAIRFARPEAAPPWAGPRALAPWVPLQDVVPERPGTASTGAAPPRGQANAPPGSTASRHGRKARGGGRYGLGSTALTMPRRASPRLPRKVRADADSREVRAHVRVRGLDVQADLHQVADAHDADQLAGVDHGDMAEAALAHDLSRLA